MVTDLEGGMYVVPGIGINVHQESFPPELKDIATSLYMESGIHVHRGYLASAVCHHLDTLRALWQEQGFKPIACQYAERMALKDEWVNLIQGDRQRRIRVAGVSEGGALQGLDENGAAVDIISGEVTVRRM
jgi:BirA family biotin operon repressor/biotin-[acetyl-CoA-carboxylase] ligase